MHKHILVVEDDLDIREALRDSLNILGYEVDLASNGQEALELLATIDNPCLIFLDLMMPIMDGFQFRDEQCKDPKISDIPVVVITADGNATRKAAKLNVKSGIKKPFEFEEIFAAVNTYCGS